MASKRQALCVPTRRSGAHAGCPKPSAPGPARIAPSLGLPDTPPYAAEGCMQHFRDVTDAWPRGALARPEMKSPHDGGLYGKCRILALQDVDEHEQAQPDHVHEVPIPGHSLEAEMMILAEMPLQHAEPDHRQHDRAQGHVQAVEAGQQKEGRA